MYNEYNDGMTKVTVTNTDEKKIMDYLIKVE